MGEWINTPFGRRYDPKAGHIQPMHEKIREFEENFVYFPDEGLEDSLWDLSDMLNQLDQIKKNVSEITFNLLLTGNFEKIEVQLKLLEEDDSTE